MTICAMCVAETHAAHAYVKIAEAAATTREEIGAAVQTAVVALAETSDGIVAVRSLKEEVDKSKDEVHKLAEKTFKDLQRGLIARMKAVQGDAQTARGNG